MRRKPIRKRATGGRSGMNNNTPRRMGKARPLLVPAPPSMAPTKKTGMQDEVMYPYCLASPEDPCCKYYGTPRFQPGLSLCYNGQYVYEQGGPTSNRARVRAGEKPIESTGVDMNQIYAEYCGTAGSEDDPCCVYFGTPRFDPHLCHNSPKMSTYNTGGHLHPVSNDMTTHKHHMNTPGQPHWESGHRHSIDPNMEGVTWGPTNIPNRGLMSGTSTGLSGPGTPSYTSTPTNTHMMTGVDGGDHGHGSSTINPNPRGGRRTTPVLANSVEDNNQLFAPTCSGPGAENNPCCINWGTPRFNPARPCWDDRAITLKKGGRTKPAVRRKAVGGSMGIPSSCPPGTHMMPDGSCMQGEYHGAPNGVGYRKGGRTNIKNKARGGSMHVGGNTACRMHTSKYDCVSPCKWDFNDGVCH